MTLLLNKHTMSFNLFNQNQAPILKLILVQIDPLFPLFGYDKYLYLFSSEIQQHINNFHQQHDRVVAFTSVLLKYYYLAEILMVKPSEIQITTNQHGKPYLLSHPQVDFNISHSKDYVVLAVTFKQKIGVDIEYIDNNVDLALKSTVFNEYECNLINNPLDFFLLWAKKEAYLKCVGTGFTTNEFKQINLNTSTLQLVDNYIIKTTIYKNFVLSLCQQINITN